ncbi:MAG: methyl-accepting chemotaxis protein [Chromatiales bacterium]|nr:methyl-accepting chemotaxis protein [Chromatiales bacterium]
MKWFQNLAFRYKLILPLGVVVLLFLLFAASTLYRIDRLGKEVANLVRADMPVITDLLQADRDLYQALVAERTLIFVDVGSANYTALAADHAQNVQQAYERVTRAAATIASSRLAALQDIAEKLQSFEASYRAWETLSRQVVESRSSDTRAGRSAAIGLTLNEASAAFESMRDFLDQLEDLVLAGSQESGQRTEADVSSSQRDILLLSVACLIVMSVVVFGLPPMIVRPIRHILERVEDIAEGEGDLRARLDENSRDETGRLAQTFNRFLNRLHQLVGQSVSSAGQLVQASERLKAVAGESDRVILEQLTQIQMVATAVHEMAATVNEIARNSAHAAESTQAAEAGVRSGTDVVGEAAVAIGHLAEVVTRASEAIQALESESKAIGAVLEVIKGVAEQTNLLALNAAIEAARAGESGRGFAVVAAEVRNLASRTQQSAGEIEAMIAALQSSARNMVGIMQSGHGMVETTLQKAEQASRSLDDITRAVTAINDMITQIASAAEEQSAVTEEINKNTLKIQQLAEYASSTNDQTAAARDDLIALTQDLHASLACFKV